MFDRMAPAADAFRPCRPLGRGQHGSIVVLLGSGGTDTCNLSDLFPGLADGTRSLSGLLCIHVREDGSRTVKAAPEAKPGAKPGRRRGRRSGTGDGGEDKTQAEILLGLVEDAYLFHNAMQQAFIVPRRDGHEEVFPVRSLSFRRLLMHLYWKATGRPPAADSVKAALDVLDAEAWAEGPLEEVSIRVGGTDEKIIVDLGDAKWRAVEITADGWSVVKDPSVRFWRPAGLRPLPVPRRGGSLDDLRPFVRCEDDEFQLLVGWLTMALRPAGPYPTLDLCGEQGSSKTTLSKMIRLLVDPCSPPTRSESKDVRDLMVAANNHWMLIYDNLSGLPPWMSDAFCRLCTGAGHATRMLYTDNDEMIFDVQRPVILNGIVDFITRGDLIDRSIFLHLFPISKSERKSEKALWKDFDARHAKILGALYDAVAAGLKALPTIEPVESPRMADFAAWGEALELGLDWEEGSFAAAYDANIRDANQAILEGSPVAMTLIRYLAGHPIYGALQAPWKGIASNLLRELGEAAGKEMVESDRWPKTGRGLSATLRRLATQLREAGVAIDFGDRKSNARTLSVKLERQPDFPVHPIVNVASDFNPEGGFRME
jgi:hypothetical protein